MDDSLAFSSKDLFIISSPHNNDKSINDYIMETYLLIKTCKRSDSGNITLICPCYPYARQDKKDNSRTCISAKDISDLFTLAGIDRIVCFDLHSAQIQGFFNIPCDNFYCINMIYDYLVKNHSMSFREAYQKTAAIVNLAEKKRKKLNELSIDELKKMRPQFRHYFRNIVDIILEQKNLKIMNLITHNLRPILFDDFINDFFGNINQNNTPLYNIFENDKEYKIEFSVNVFKQKTSELYS